MAIESTVLKLESNPKVVYENVSRILIKIADNILKQPNDLKLRTLQKTNATISQKVLAAAGGLECLKIMGFIEVCTQYCYINNLTTVNIPER